MFWKGFRIALIVTLVVLFGLTFLMNTLVNRDTDGFERNFSTIDAQKITNHPSHNGDFEVVMISTGCPGRHSFMPYVIRYTEQLRARGEPYFIINDDIMGPKSEAELKRFQAVLGMNDTIYFLDRNTYPDSGGLLRGKLRYRQFVEELCGQETDFLYGYPMSLQFQSGQYAGWSLALPDSAKRALFRQHLLEQN